MNKRKIFVLIVFITLLTGCSSQPGVKGKVTFSDDGSPLTQGIIVFEASGNVARGEINKDGTYVIGSVKTKDGLPKGQYKVYITETAQIAAGPNGPALIRPIDAKYENPNTSGLEVDVQKSITYDIKVDRPD
ncbi:MAG: hypothetical protein ACRC2T_04540 [Thermoguttaceae bacterium]